MTPSCIYELDAQDWITRIEGHWEEFASDNDAPELTKESVLGKPIWSSIEGDDVRHLFAIIFERVRKKQKSKTLEFHCDSSTTIRIMRMTLEPLPHKGIRLSTALVEIRIREPIELFSRGQTRGMLVIPVCSLCRQLQIDGNWLTAEVVMDSGHFCHSKSCPQLLEKVCPDCWVACDGDTDSHAFNS